MSKFHLRALEGNVDLGPMNKYLDNKKINDEPVCFFLFIKFIILNKKIYLIIFF